MLVNVLLLIDSLQILVFTLCNFSVCFYFLLPINVTIAPMIIFCNSLNSAYHVFARSRSTHLIDRTIFEIPSLSKVKS